MPKMRSRLRRKRWLAMAAFLSLTACATACTAAPERPPDDRKHVVTTFTVLADMTRAVAGDRVEVSSITKPGAEIHEYEPTPSDLVRTSRADLVLDNGLGLERWFDRFLQDTDVEHVTLTDGITPIPIRNGDYRGHANPHAWMSPKNARLYVTNIRDALTRLDPEHAAEFHANAERYLHHIGEIERYLVTEIDQLPPQHRALVTCEGAFSYLARDTGLTEAYLWPVNSDGEGTPQQVIDTTKFVRQHRVPTVFCESTVNDKAQRQVAAETGAALGEVLHVDSLSEADGPVPTYLDLLRHDAEAVVAGLSGATR